ncbi:hypothetical protein NMG60_11034904 [Bertholletia excelsa]
MGYSMSRLEIDSDLLCDRDKYSSEVGGNHRPNKPFNYLRSVPHGHLSDFLPQKSELPVSLVKMLVGGQGNYSGRGRFSQADCCHVLSRYLPVNSPHVVDQMPTQAYVSQFSADDSLVVAGFPGSNIKIYTVEKRWKVQKYILAKNQCYLVYASMSPIIHIVNVGSAATESLANITEIHDVLDFSGEDDAVGYSSGIFSVKFSTDGRQLVAGSSDDSIYVYDLEANKLSLQILAHTSDVNTICFADETSHLIYSGSDDILCKVWDRRCFKARGKPAGVLMGHLEGITFIDSRADGRYFISNGKDQTIKLWDIRRMSSNAACNPGFRNYEWDYRWMDYPPQARGWKLPCDQSLATYKGHLVLRTLIRCCFSPAYSTGQGYIYTGSHDASVYVYDVVSGSLLARLDQHEQTVRDCSWHPQYPLLVSSGWDEEIVKWEFPGRGEVRSAVKKKKNDA